MEIQNVNFKSIRIGESIQFFYDVYEFCKDNDFQTLKIEKQAKALKVIVDEMNSSYNVKRGSEITKEIMDADKRRDDAIVCLRTVTEGYTSHFDDEKRNAAVQLLNTIDKYGSGIARMNYHAESTVLDNLGLELTSDEKIKAWVKKLTLSDVALEIVDANKALKNKFRLRVKDDAEKNDESATDLFKPSIESYNALKEHIEAHATLSPSDAYKTLIDQLNELINKYNTMLSMRSGNDDSESE